MKLLITAGASALFGAIVSLTLIGQAQSAKTPSAVAYVSPNRILTESVRGRAEATRLQSIQQQRTADLRAKAQAIESTRNELAANADAASRSALLQKEVQQRADFERATQQAQLDVQNLQRQINTDLNQRVRAILDEFMKTQTYQLVLNADTSLTWVNPELDLTPAVIQRLNAQ